MNLRTPKKIKSDYNRIIAQRAVVLNDPIFKGKEEKDLIDTYDSQLRQLNYELTNSEETCYYIERIMDIKVVDPVIVTANNVLSC